MIRSSVLGARLRVSSAALAVGSSTLNNMPALIEVDQVTSPQVDEKLKCIKYQNSIDSDLSESKCIVGEEGDDWGSKAESGEGHEECGSLAVLSTPAPADSTMPTPSEESDCSIKKGSYEVTIEHKKAVNHVDGNEPGSEETSNGLKSSKHPDKSEEDIKKEPGHDDLDRGWAFLVVLGTFSTMVMLSQT